MGGSRRRRDVDGRRAGFAVDFYDDPSFGPDPARTMEFNPSRAGMVVTFAVAIVLIAGAALLLVFVAGILSIGSMVHDFGFGRSDLDLCRSSEVDLIKAATDNDDGRVETLLAEHVDPDARDRNGKQALLCATEAGNERVAMVLLRHGASSASLSIPTRHTLMAAMIDADDVDAVSFLLDHQIDPNETIGVLADEAAHGKPKVLRELIHRGADAGAALRAAVDAGDLEATKTALDAGANPDGVTPGGLRTYSPLLRAAFDQRGDIVDALLGAGADPNDGGEIGELPMQVALRSIVDRHQNSRLANLNLSTLQYPGNLPPIVAAATNGDALMVSRLLHAHADPNKVGFGRFTALHGAVLSGDAHVVHVLLDNGAVPTPTLDPGAPSPHDLAVLDNLPDIAALLDSAPPTTTPPR